jgi:hypothetical protein
VMASASVRPSGGTVIAGIGPDHRVRSCRHAAVGGPAPDAWPAASFQGNRQPAPGMPGPARWRPARRAGSTNGPLFIAAGHRSGRGHDSLSGHDRGRRAGAFRCGLTGRGLPDGAGRAPVVLAMAS